ncbi:triosephosphate isomerase [Rhodospirillales bacterium TMPK1]|uniref:Triosephosphate isomerase n=2 Tax=Roseiterribacter gracilis TaxID=2812848 RepID=A0A8S8XA63_9PROT|nr:triosephosphate isomerase [Rhodospirillales bacterium TMPK1]
MNGSLAAAEAFAFQLGSHLAKTRSAAELLVCPPATLLQRLGEKLRPLNVELGAQDCHAKPSGAFTGDLGAPMLVELGCRYVIVGHSERRQFHKEDDATVRAKAEAALAAGLTPIVCVGETEAQRESGQAESVVGSQLAGSLPEAGAIVVAYEPVWAIGTGKNATQADIQAMHGFLRSRLGTRADATRLLYGGSVKPQNAAETLATPNVDGVLVGGASLAAEDFWAIASATPAR